MSRLSKKEITIPPRVEVKMDGLVLSVKGPLGELKRELRKEVAVDIKDGKIKITPGDASIFSRAFSGTCVSHLLNMIEGTTKGFQKKLIIEGTGYRANVSGNALEMSLGYSHPVKLAIPEGIKVEITKSEIAVSGIDKEKVGSFCALIRDQKKPEPYKGKGIRYSNEIIARKQGKRSVT